MTEPTNDEINRHIALNVMGLPCYHEAENDEYATVRCKLCGNGFGGGAWERANPDYCSPDSPRRLLDEAEAKAIEMVGPTGYGLALQPIIKSYTCNWDDYARFATATATQRATAIYYATKEGE